MGFTVLMSQAYINEMNKISKSLSSYPGFKSIATELEKIIPSNVVAGLIGCIIPESGTNHRILNSKEYYGKGASGTSGWNCGEGLIQWTHWKEKLPLIKLYNADSRSTQKLPETWEEYSQGTPVKEGNQLLAQEDGKHIAGLSLANQMLFLTIYYKTLISSVSSETNLATITAKIYQQKAGIGFYKNISDPIVRAYTTSKNKYPSSAGNHYLQSVKIAQEYSQYPVTANYVDEFNQGHNTPAPYEAGYYGDTETTSEADYSFKLSNSVTNLALVNKRKDTLLQQSDSRKNDFNALRNKMVSELPKMGRSVLLSEELYDSNILKGDQEAKKDRK